MHNVSECIPSIYIVRFTAFFWDRYVDLYIAPRFGIPLAYKEFNKMRVSQFVVQLQEICNKDTAQS